MKRLLVDSTDNIIYEGKDAKEVYRVLSANPEDISEKDEIIYEELLRTTDWNGKLRFEVHFDLEFEGIDDWNRPIFKDIESNIRFGDVENLYNWNTPKKDIIDYYKKNNNGLVYFGDHFDCEPNGGRSDLWKFNIIEYGNIEQTRTS